MAWASVAAEQEDVGLETQGRGQARIDAQGLIGVLLGLLEIEALHGGQALVGQHLGGPRD